MTETEPGKETTEDVELLDVSRGGGRGEGVEVGGRSEENCWVLHDLHVVIYVFFKMVTVMCVYMQELNRVLHSMQTRVADLIGRCTDEVVLGECGTQTNPLYLLFALFCPLLPPSLSFIPFPHFSFISITSPLLFTSSSIPPENTLQINDELNTVFVRYERWLRNMEAAKSGGKTEEEETAQPAVTQPETANGVATTSLTQVGQALFPAFDGTLFGT